MIYIPYALDYSATAGGSILRLVQCEKCGEDYGYILKREATGTGTSLFFQDNQGARDRAAQRAHRALQAKLEQSCDPVPCPHCNWYQRDMVDRLRRLRYRWMKITGIILLPFILIAALILLMVFAVVFVSTAKRDLLGPETWPLCALGVLLGFSGPLLLILRLRRMARYDPNEGWTGSEGNKTWSRAISGDDLKQLLDRIAAATGSAPEELL